MSDSTSLLIEVGTEELPVKALPGLAQAFFDGVIAGLEKRGVAFERADANPLYTPRRLAVLLPQVAIEQPEQRSEALGPYANIALDANGEPTSALKGFAQKNGLDVAQLERITDAKGERFVARSVKPGAATASLLPAILHDAIKAMPIPKPMRWGDHDYAFARPVHWLVMLLGDSVVDAELFGIKADRMSRGHRFHHPKPVWIGKPEDYVDALRGAQVLVDADERRTRVSAEIEAAAERADGVARIPDALLEEVNCLVEWPKAILCGFEPAFLRVPQEALISTMEANQKFFPLLNHEHRLTERFIGIANIASTDEDEIRKGYERVIRPRFADAQFFYDEDIKQGLDAMRSGLASVTYQQKLGSYADKTARVMALAEAIAKEVGVDPEHARRAAELSKADLQSRMVNEFPELQGIAGRYYASAAGVTGDIADAIDQAYMPRFGGDAIAPTKLGQVLAIAERLDTLAGGFAAGLKPTGNKDPFALRRNALGLARTLLEGGHDLSVAKYVTQALELQPIQFGSEAAKDFSMFEICEEFIYDRLRSYYADRGVPSEQFEAVNSTFHDSLPDFDARLKAIGEFA
ncbi:MAG: glycine--tRNA ligase subunit beta, partial [Lysobacteraceae bacterium]